MHPSPQSSSQHSPWSLECGSGRAESHDCATILVVDDTEQSRNALAEALAGEGYRIVLSDSGQHALDVASRVLPDLVLLDVMMPGMDGYETCRRLRRDPALADIPVIMVTALDDRQSRLRGIESGADDFLSKPLDRQELRARVRTITRLNRYRRLLSERERVERLFSLSPDGIVVMDDHWQIQLANDAFHRMLALAGHRQLKKTSLWQFVERGQQASLRKALVSVLDEELEAVTLETKFKRLDDRVFPVELAIGFCHWEHSRACQMLIRDITNRKLREEEIRLLQRLEAVDRTAREIAHDFSKYLDVIHIHLKCLAIDEQTHPAIASIGSAVQQASSLARRFMSFSREECASPETVSLDGLLLEEEEMLRQHLIDCSVDLNMSLASAAHITIDRSLFRQLMMNLVVNARDAIGRKGTITVRTFCTELSENHRYRSFGVKAGAYAVIEVSDDGVGMDEKIKEQIFLPFFSTKEKGTGLGLSMVFRAVRQARGHIDVESRLGSGSVFKILLPVKPTGDRGLDF